MFDWLDPWSVKSLRKRAQRLPECAYKLVLEMCADQLEAKKVDKVTVKTIIEYTRRDEPELSAVAMQLLRLNDSQVAVAKHLLEKMP